LRKERIERREHQAIEILADLLRSIQSCIPTLPQVEPPKRRSFVDELLCMDIG
jgi:hypothetical protein